MLALVQDNDNLNKNSTCGKQKLTTDVESD